MYSADGIGRPRLAAINTAYAWYIHMEGARMFYGHRSSFFCYGLFEEKATLFSRRPAKPIVMTQGANHQLRRIGPGTENSDRDAMA